MNRRQRSLPSKRRDRVADRFHILEEPLLTFGNGQSTEDPRDGLALFGPTDASQALGDYIVVGTPRGLRLWPSWLHALNSAAACVDVKRQRPWPPYPGFDVAFGVRCPKPSRSYELDSTNLDRCARKADKHERAFSVANAYLEAIRQTQRLDARPKVAVCIVPDDVFENCRIQSSVSDKSDAAKSAADRQFIKAALDDQGAGQIRMFDEQADVAHLTQNLEKYGLSPDFRRQLKARVMELDIPVQIIKESTLDITEDVRQGARGVNPLSDRLWNFSTALYYKSGRKPWKTPWARPGVCYIGLAYRKSETSKTSACCAAQMFLDSGDGIVFIGEYGPWYSEERKGFHMKPDAAEEFIRGAIKTYQQEDGRPLREIFLHSRSGIDADEYAGFQRGCPSGVKVVGIRVRQDPWGPRLFRHGAHADPARRGLHPVLRGAFWQRTERLGLLFSSGFKPRLGTYDGWEVPVPLSVTVQQGEADLVQVATDILGLTKLNYNACRLGESNPITVKYSDRIGEILLANPTVPKKYWRPNFRFYI